MRLSEPGHSPSAVLVGPMNIATTRGLAKSSLSLPNILTIARIAAIPLVVGCIYAQAILDWPLWLRWVALAVFIAAAVTDFLDGYYARMWDQQSALVGCWIRLPTSCWSLPAC
jgi:cardiolipin synthase